MNRILNRNKTIKITNSRKIVDVRNRIIHGYDTISDEIIWGIIIRQLPVLKIEIERMINE